MIQGLKQKIISIYLSKRKLFNFIGVFLFAGVLILFVGTRNKKKTTQPQTTPPAQITPSAKPYTASPDKDYFINQIVTNLIPVTGHSWKGNKLIYSTPNGIYEAGTNTLLLEQKIEKIIWANSFNAVLKSEGTWKKFDYLNKTAVKLSFPLNNPIINSKGEKILDYQNKTVRLFNLIDNTNKEIPLEESVAKVFFIEDRDGFIISTSSGDKTHVYKYNANSTLEQSNVFGRNLKLSLVSPDGNTFLLTAGKELVVANFSESLANTVFTKSSKLSVGYTNNNEVVIVEKYQDSLGRLLENIYLSDLRGNKFKIADSKQVKNRLNLNLPIAFSQGGGITSFVENNGKIWILSLAPNLFPTYSTKGSLVFTKMESKGF